MELIANQFRRQKVPFSQQQRNQLFSFRDPYSLDYDPGKRNYCLERNSQRKNQILKAFLDANEAFIRNDKDSIKRLFESEAK